MKLFWCSGGGRCDEALREREKENRAFRNVPDKTKDKEEDLALHAGDHCRADVRKLSVHAKSRNRCFVYVTRHSLKTSYFPWAWQPYGKVRIGSQ